MKKLILASASPRRKELLQQLGLKFDVAPSDYAEDMTKKLPPRKLAAFLSRGKAEAVAKNYQNAVVIAADTFVVLKNELLGKPRTPKEAQAMLRKISGKTLAVITGFTIVDTDTRKKVSRSVEAKIRIKKLAPDEIAAYVKTGEPLDKAGAFAVQGRGAAIVERIEGDFFAVVGLPLFDLAEALKKFGIAVF